MILPSQRLSDNSLELTSSRFVFFLFATRRATFRTRFGLTFAVARTIRFRFAFTIARSVTFSARLAIARLVPIRASHIGTTFAVARRLPSAFGRTISLRASVTFAGTSAVGATLWRTEQLRSVELAVFVAIQFAEDFFQPIEFIEAEPAIFILVEQLKKPRHRASTTFTLWRRRTIAVWATITLRRTIALGRSFARTTIGTTLAITWRRLTFTSSFRLAITVRFAITVASNFRAVAIRLRFGTTIAFWLAIAITACFPFANLSERFEIIQCQHVLFRTLKHRPSTIAELFRNFIERDFAVAVRVHPLELLFGILIRPAPWISRSARRRTHLRHRATELFL